MIAAHCRAMFLACALAPMTVAGAPTVGDEAAESRRLAFLRDAERSLASGAVERANTALDAAAEMAHSADTELLQVRALLQAGHYRQAASLAAHADGDHRDDPTAAALYAWLLAIGGQEQIGRRRLDEALAGAGTDPIALAVQRLFAEPGAGMPPSLMQPPHRFAPYAVMEAGVSPPSSAVVAALGVLWEQGSFALVPVDAVQQASHLWVRNGLGQTVPARGKRALPGLPLILLELSTPLPDGDASPVLTDPLAGSPACAAAYPTVADAAPAWPSLHHGFFGGVTLSSNERRLGIALPPGPRGGPVFDKAGHLAGVAIAQDAGGDMLVTIPQIRAALGATPVAAPSSLPQSNAMASFDEEYERAMRVALQVIVER